MVPSARAHSPRSTIQGGVIATDNLARHRNTYHCLDRSPLLLRPTVRPERTSALSPFSAWPHAHGAVRFGGAVPLATGSKEPRDRQPNYTILYGQQEQAGGAVGRSLFVCPQTGRMPLGRHITVGLLLQTQRRGFRRPVSSLAGV